MVVLSQAQNPGTSDPGTCSGTCCWDLLLGFALALGCWDLLLSFALAAEVRQTFNLVLQVST